MNLVEKLKNDLVLAMKEKDKVKYCELVCLMSICKLESNEHKFLIYKKAE